MKKILITYEARQLGSNEHIEDTLVITRPCAELFNDVLKNGYDAFSSCEIKDAVRAVAQLRGHIVFDVSSITAFIDEN